MEKRTVILTLGFLSLMFGTCINISKVYASTCVSVTVVTGSSNGNVYVYNEVGDLLWSYYTGADVASVAVSSNGAFIAVGSLGNKLYVFARDGTKLWEKTVPIAYGGSGYGTESKSVAISAQGEYIVAGCTDNLYVYKKDGTLHWSHAGKETCVGISPNATYIVACNRADGTIDFFHISSNTPLWTKSIGASWVATSNPGYVIASTSSKAFMFDNAGTQLWSYTLDRGGIVRVDMPEDGLTAVVANDDPGNVACYLWYFNLSGLVWKYTPCPPEHDFYSVSISADGNIISMGPGNIAGIYIFSRDGTSLQTMPQSSWVQSVDLTSDGQFGVWGDRTAGTVWFFSKDSSTPLWSRAIGGMVHAVAIACLEEWPMFHHDLRHTGYSTSIAPNTNNTIWNYTTGDWVWSSSPAVADDRVYVGSWDNKTYCLNATTGEHIWNYTTGWFVESSPAVAYGKVYVGSYDGKIYCLNAMTGVQIWNYTTGDIVVSSPAVAGGRVYVGSLDNKVYCLNATSGEHIWNYTAGDWVSSSPAVVEGRVYVGSGDQKVYCLNASTEAEIWNYTTGNWVSSSPAVVDGRVYVGSADHKIYCLNASTGVHIWNYTTGDYVVSSPAVANGRVYIGSWDDKVYCLNATSGEHIWNYTTGSVIYSSPAVADGKVYVGSNDRRVYCLNASTGTEIWSYITGGRVVSSPAIADGKVFVGSEDTKVYAFEDPIYTLSITTSDGGTTTPAPGTYTYRAGTTITITAISDTGYEFNHWELDDSWNYSNPIIVTMDSDHTLHVVFTYDATVIAHCYTENTDVSVSILMDGLPMGYSTPHTFANLTGTHNFTVPGTDLSGHLFKQWNTGETSTTIIVSSGGTYTAYYEAKYNLTITTTTGGTTNPLPGNYSYWDGTEVSVTAIPSLGYILDYWRLDENNVGRPNTITVTMDSNHTLQAIFLQVGICNLTITTTTGGTTNPLPGTYSYTNGTVVSVTATTPALGYVFDHWKLDDVNVGTTNPMSVTMDKNHTLHAVFLWVGICKLTITTSTGGTTNPAPGTYSYTNGTAANVRAISSAHYVFDYWELDGSNAGSENPITVTMDSNHTLHAVFKYSPQGVGGVVVPVDKLGLLAPYFGLTSTIIVAVVATAIYAKRVNRKKEKQ